MQKVIRFKQKQSMNYSSVIRPDFMQWRSEVSNELTHELPQEVSEFELPNWCLENEDLNGVIPGHLWKMTIIVPWSGTTMYIQ